ncbi:MULTISPECIES: AI-2E family transporter [Legionella]|uniref:Transporter, permease n=1 Tax=Legionella drozanskii LLAP-1 TaxID=1212489 RepID=A0A0W0TBG7_9GAMM|nr:MULTISPECIES: AI-2E family transporter [Legionella]KTC92905.1 transporter, permease [Legionella drozanskii LLAP-1]
MMRPFSQKYFYFIVNSFLTGYILVISAPIFNPLLAALILALALKPFATFLEKFKVPRLLASLISVIAFVIVLAGLILFFQAQIRNIDFKLGHISQNMVSMPTYIQSSISNFFGINQEQQTSLLNEVFTIMIKNSTVLFNHTLSFTTALVASISIFIIALFFFLNYRKFFKKFLFKVVNEKYHPNLNRILTRILSVVSRYILGLLLIIFIVALLNTLGLWLLGVEHAILFGVLAAVLILIPYIGIFIGSLLPALFVLLTKGSFGYAIAVIFIFIIVQFLEGNFFTPNIVGSQVSVNPFAAILGLLIGGLLLGITGIMFALPVLAITKVICDEIKSLEPIGYLISNPK